MPNHCETDLSIYGRRDQVEAVLKQHVTEKGELECDSIIPYPDTYKELDRISEEWHTTYFLDEYGFKLKPEYEGVKIPERPIDGFNSGGYGWCIENWGTKWGTYSGNGVVIVEHDNDMIEAQLSFESAWSPPRPVLEKMAELYPNLTFRAESFEGGAAYHLIREWKDGQLVHSSDHRYDGERGG